MKNFCTILILVLLFVSCKSNKDTTLSTTDIQSKVIANADPSVYASTITADELKEMLYIYASDEFEGRYTGEKGQKMASEYIKKQYVSLDIKSPLGGDDYFQEVPLKSYFSPEVDLKVNGTAFSNYDHFVSFSSMVSNNINSDEIIYVGFGVDEANYSDYSNMDVKGKIVIAKAGEPKNEDGTYIVSGTSTTSKWSSARTKRDAAKERGAKAMFLLDIAMFERYSAYYKRQNENGNSIGLSFPTEDGMYAFLINEDLAKAFIPDINTNATPAVIKADLEIKYTGKSKDIDTENVVAYIKGSEKPNEYIVISAHLDHVGITDGNVFNGADDDGSGTVAMLEIAEAFQEAVKNGHTPKRSIVFLHVTGEERGLLGSRYYTDMDPIFPLAQTVANLNIDMVGRTDPKREGSRNYIYLIGADKLSTELHDLSETMNTKYTQMELDYKYNDENDPNRFYYRSDHYNFAKNNVPIIFYFNGTHDDYHKHTDTPDKIQYDLLENRSKLIFYTAWEIANRDKRLVVDKAKEAVGSH